MLRMMQPKIKELPKSNAQTNRHSHVNDDLGNPRLVDNFYAITGKKNLNFSL